MHFIFPKIISWIIALVGLIFLYAAFFLYSDAQNKVHNSLSNLALKSKNLQTKYLKINFAIQTLHKYFNSNIKRYFEIKPISINTYLILNILSFASLFLFMGGFYDNEYQNKSLPIIFVIAGISIIATLILFPKRKLYLLLFLIACYVILAVIYFTFRTVINYPLVFLLIITLTVFLSSLAGIALLYLINYFSESKYFKTRWPFLLLVHFITMVFIRVVSLIAAFIIYNLDVIIAKWLTGPLHLFLLSGSLRTLNPIDNPGLVLSISLSAFAYLQWFYIVLFLLIILAVLNRVLWPVLRFTLRFITEHKLHTRRKFLFCIGTVLLTIAFPHFKGLEILKRLFDTLNIG